MDINRNQQQLNKTWEKVDVLTGKGGKGKGKGKGGRGGRGGQYNKK